MSRVRKDLSRLPMKILLDVIGAKVEADGTAWVWYDEP